MVLRKAKNPNILARAFARRRELHIALWNSVGFWEDIERIRLWTENPIIDLDLWNHDVFGKASRYENSPQNSSQHIARWPQTADEFDAEISAFSDLALANQSELQDCLHYVTLGMVLRNCEHLRLEILATLVCRRNALQESTNTSQDEAVPCTAIEQTKVTSQPST
jgi:hypothetical protein